MAVKLCRLVDGSLSIGELTETHLCDAIEVAIQHTEEGMRIGLLPYMYPFNNNPNGINIPINRIMCEMDAPADITSEYSKAVTPSCFVSADSIPAALKQNHLSVVK